MKGLLALVVLCFAFSAWPDVTYPVKNYPYISDWDYREEVQDSKKYVVMVFSSNQCLDRVVVDRSCFLFEKKFDYFVPGFSKNVKVVGFNTYFENYQVVSLFHIEKVPSVIILKDNKIIDQIEPNFARPDISNGRLNWQDELLKEVLSKVRRIL